DRGYGQAGLVIGAWTAGVTVGAPILGRFIQRYGLRPVLAGATPAPGGVLGLGPPQAFPVFPVGGHASGPLLGSGTTLVRLAFGGLVPREQRHPAFAVVSMITEVSIMIGPALAVLVISQTSTKGALISLCIALVISCGALAVFNPRIEGAPAAGDTIAPA